ncbi:hypothetical protein LguiB_024130 [Lonicera macranthoides]
MDSPLLDILSRDGGSEDQSKKSRLILMLDGDHKFNISYGVGYMASDIRVVLCGLCIFPMPLTTRAPNSTIIWKLSDVPKGGVSGGYGWLGMESFEEIGFYGNLDFFTIPLGEGEMPPETVAETNVEEEYSDEEMDVNELEKRMWRDKILVKGIKEQNKGEEGVVDNAKQRQSQEQARRKKMSRAQDGILKYMLKMMEDCNAQGFVYGIIPEKGKPISGASDNLRAWWKEKVRFDRNGPAAVTKYLADCSILGKFEDGTTLYPDSCLSMSTAGGTNLYLVSETNDYDVEGIEDECKPHDVNLFNLGAEGSSDCLMMLPNMTLVKGEPVNTSFNFVRKRKQTCDEPCVMMDQKICKCASHQCPYYRFGVADRSSRKNHEMNCMNRKKEPAVFSVPSETHKPAAPLMNQGPVPFNVTGLGIPEDGQRMISELVSFYDTNLPQNKNPDLPRNLNIIGDQNLHQQGEFQQLQLDDNFVGPGIMMGGNIYDETNIPLNYSFFPQMDFQFGDANSEQNGVDLRFGSLFNLEPINDSVNPQPKQDSVLFI